MGFIIQWFWFERLYTQRTSIERKNERIDMMTIHSCAVRSMAFIILISIWVANFNWRFSSHFIQFFSASNFIEKLTKLTYTARVCVCVSTIICVKITYTHRIIWIRADIQWVCVCVSICPGCETAYGMSEQCHELSWNVNDWALWGMEREREREAPKRTINEKVEKPNKTRYKHKRDKTEAWQGNATMFSIWNEYASSQHTHKHTCITKVFVQR